MVLTRASRRDSPRSAFLDYFNEELYLDETRFNTMALAFVASHIDATANEGLRTECIEFLECRGEQDMPFLERFSIRFRPTLRVDIFDSYVERTTSQDMVKSGEVFSDGYRGQIRVLDSSHQILLEELFTQPQLVRVGPGLDAPEAMKVDPALNQLKPFRRRTIEHLVEQ